MANPIAQTLAKKSFFLPGSGLRAPRCRLRNLPALWSLAEPPLTPPITLTKACVSTLNRSGAVGEAAMFGRKALLPLITMLWSWFGKAEVASPTPSPVESTVKPVTCEPIEMSRAGL